MMNRFFVSNSLLVRGATTRSSFIPLPLTKLISYRYNTITNKLTSITKLTSTAKLQFSKFQLRSLPTWRDLQMKTTPYGGFGGRGGSSWKSLAGPTGFFIASSVAMAIVFPKLFQLPPFNYFNRHPQLLIYAIILANVGVFFMWQMPQFYRLLDRHFLLHKPLTSYFSMIGSAFSHQEVWHIGFNMLMLYSFGTSFITAIGPAMFMSMYCSAAIFSSLASLAWPVLLKLLFMPPSLGASGALFGLFATVAYLFPHIQLSVMFIPFPGGAWTLLWAFTGLNLAGMVLRWGGMDYAAHLGGTFIGIFWGWWISRVSKRSRRVRRGF